MTDSIASPHEQEKYEVFREVWRITERRDNSVYKTEFVERRWVPMGATKDPDDENLIYASVSTSYQYQNQQERIGIRRKQ